MTLPARHPDELLAWTAGADVALVPLPPVSVNQRLSRPNKFAGRLSSPGRRSWSASGLTLMADITTEGDLGVVSASERPGDLARAIVAALERTTDDPGWPARIRETATDRYSWPVAAEAYREVVRLVGG